MSAHPTLGATILLENQGVGPLGVAAAWGHHLRFDGGGYPPTPSWRIKSKVTSLVQACDVFEALTAVRPYKAPMAPRRGCSARVDRWPA